MKTTPEFHTLIERIESFLPGEDLPEAILAQIAQTYKMSHASYLGIDFSYYGERRQLIYTTYQNSGLNRYIVENYIGKDPTIISAFESTIPVDSSELLLKNKNVKGYLNDERNYKAGERFITTPIRGARSEKGLFTLNGDMNDAEWGLYKKTFLPEILTIGFYVHCMIVKNLMLNHRENKIKLTPRESLCLEWASKGKTFNDIAYILGISNHTVRIHLDAAREKLKCLNVTHAVARAIKLELIRSPL